MSTTNTSQTSFPVPVTPAAGVQRFALVADTQGLSLVDQIVDDINTYTPEFYVQPGDLVSVGGLSSWRSWKSLTADFVGGPDKRYVVPGNHDLPIGGQSNATWQQEFDWLPDSQPVSGTVGVDKMDYYVDEGRTRLISITTDRAEGAGGPPAALDWLEAVLDETKVAKRAGLIDNVFVFSHHPVTYQNESRTGGTAGDWWRTMAQSGVVDALMTGHWHIYQPSRPDPSNDMWELIIGTGGGGLEGVPSQNEHGWMLIDIHDTGRVEATFFGDDNGAANGWEFQDIRDQFVIKQPIARPTGLVAYYGFNYGAANLDTAPSDLAKQNHGSLHGNAAFSAEGILGRSLSVDGSGDYADGAELGDFNMALIRDLTISLHANFQSLAAGEDQNILTVYGEDFRGPNESINNAYQLRLRDDKRLELSWEHDDTVEVAVRVDRAGRR